ncbi:hypothetical protein MMC21_008159 [Puttea exsequens]|nr:hypothetical protein [Puttea exsequens]
MEAEQNPLRPRTDPDPMNMREVYIMAQRFWDQETATPVDVLLPDGSIWKKGTKMWPIHSWVWVRDQDNLADRTDRSHFKTEVGLDQTINPDQDGLHIRGFDWTERLLEVGEENSVGDVIIKVGETHLTNTEIMNPTTGEGLVAKVWKKNPVYAQGAQYAKELNNCNNFCLNLAQDPDGFGFDLSQNEEVQDFIKRSYVWNRYHEDAEIKERVEKLAHFTATEDKKNPIRSIFDLPDLCRRDAGACLVPVAGEQEKVPWSGQNTRALDPNAMEFLSFDELKLQPGLGVVLVPDSLAAKADGDKARITLTGQPAK